MDKAFIKQVFNMLLFLLGTIVFNRISAGGGVALLILLSAFFALSGKIGWFMVVYMMIPFLTEMNAELVGRGVLFHYGARIAVFSSTFLLLIRFASARGRHSLPIGGMFIYLFCAGLSSAQGYCPPVSYLKLINFSVFMLGLYFGGRMVSEDLRDLNRMRAALLAFAMFMVFGSIAMYMVPSYGYMNVGSLATQGYSEKQIAEQLAEGGLNLFRGVANHSQTLAGMLVVFIAWVSCDMLFIEHKTTKLHGAILLAAFPLLYMSRSRTALLGVFTLMFMLASYAIPKAHLPVALKNNVRKSVWGFGLLAILSILALQLKDEGFSKWVRKTESSHDERGLVEAVTASRMGLVEQNLYDFRRNKLLGSGFQVSEEVAEMYSHSEGLMISAPIEKGVLPLMVLGEGGILGAIAFVIFLLMFYGGCSRNRYVVTATLFTIYVMLNMSEATFFSANGGGTQWVVLLIGGYIVDTCARAHTGQWAPRFI